MHTLNIERRTERVGLIRLRVSTGPDAGKTALIEDEPLTVGTAETNGLVLTDPAVSRFHVELRRTGAQLIAVDLRSTNGTEVTQAILRGTEARLSIGSTLQVGTNTLTIERGENVERELPATIASGLVGTSLALRSLMVTAKKIASSEASVVLRDESGTGKELLAHQLHDWSPRRTGPFVVVDCGALTPSLFVSELFGHEKGAFTGADSQHQGAFERAKGGTVLLDEVGELPPAVQVALLGAIERRSVRRVGGKTDFAIDVRIMAATHRDLRQQVNDGSFRLDLYHRLAVVSLELPPLRERKEDIVPLLKHFLALTDPSASFDALFPLDVRQRLERAAWPGNVRELRNVVVSAVALGTASHDPSPDPAEPEAKATDAQLVQSYREARAAVLREFERSYLEGLLKQSGGNVRQAARDARMDRSYLIELLKRHGLS